MVNFLKVKFSVDVSTNFFRVRVRAPRLFTDFRVPEWACRVSNSIVKGSKVTMGYRNGRWFVQSVLLPKTKVKGIREAKKYAREIVRKIENIKGLVW